LKNELHVEDPYAAYPGRPLMVKEVDVAESEFDAVKKIGTAKARSTDWYHQETIDTASMSIRQVEDYVGLINTEDRAVSPAIAVHLK